MPRCIRGGKLSRPSVRSNEDSPASVGLFANRWQRAGDLHRSIYDFTTSYASILLNAAEILAGQEGGRVDTVLYSRKRKGRIYVEISDNGPGIKPEEQSRMFEPYYSTKRSGTGLGLAIVKSIISDHHGHIRVKPNEPAGTTFVIELPAARRARVTSIPLCLGIRISSTARSGRSGGPVWARRS